MQAGSRRFLYRDTPAARVKHVDIGALRAKPHDVTRQWRPAPAMFGNQRCALRPRRMQVGDFAQPLNMIDGGGDGEIGGLARLRQHGQMLGPHTEGHGRAGRERTGFAGRGKDRAALQRKCHRSRALCLHLPRKQVDCG